jgi:hypothetical protein
MSIRYALICKFTFDCATERCGGMAALGFFSYAARNRLRGARVLAMIFANCVQY